MAPLPFHLTPHFLKLFPAPPPPYPCPSRSRYLSVTAKRGRGGVGCEGGGKGWVLSLSFSNYLSLSLFLHISLSIILLSPHFDSPFSICEFNVMKDLVNASFKLVLTSPYPPSPPLCIISTWKLIAHALAPIPALVPAPPSPYNSPSPWL